MKPVLLATDGSPSATEATREAIDLAQSLGTSLLVVAVEHVAVPSYGSFGYAEVYADMTKVEHEHVQSLLEDTAAKADDAGVDCDVIATTGPIVEEICRIAEERSARLIVIGAHGWGPLRRLLFGSVSLGVLHEAPCPVLVARSVEQVARQRASEKELAAF
jgi:nucleotide-binding universal stress UspA family protein